MEKLRELLLQHYNLIPSEIELLEGYADKTYRVHCENDTYVLKLQRIAAELPDRFHLERELAHGLNETAPYDFPVCIPASDGRNYIEHHGQYIRLLSYLEGEFLANIEITESTLESLGDLMGRIDRQSQELQPGLLAGDISVWDLQHLGLHRKAVCEVEPARDRSLIAYFIQLFDNEVVPEQYNLPKSLIHNDANDWNILTQKGRVSGIIDFGDMCYSWRINELAVALTYVLPSSNDPLKTACTVLRAYLEHIPLTPLELRLLYHLIGARICTSLCNSALTSKAQPDSAYIRISEEPLRKLMRKWVGISPEGAFNSFLKAAGMEINTTSTNQSLLTRRKKLFPPSLSLSYDRPIAMHRAAFQYMFDDQGTQFLDAYNNIMLVGHCHPKVVADTSRVLKRLNTNTRYLYEELLDYSERLLTYFPPKLCRVFLVNSGSAATDLALRLSRSYTGLTKVLALEQGYHGNTMAGIEVSHYKHLSGDRYSNTLICPMPKVFGSGLIDDGTAGAHFSKFAQEILHKNREKVAAFIAEPIIGCGGQVPLPVGFLPSVYKAVRAQGGVCISDEVQVGFGRLGNWNWGYEKYGVIPDMVILGKPMGNGHPIGAVVTTEAIASTFDSGPEFFSSFGGNPVSCAAGLAVLDVLEEEGLR
ncbi:MAG: aminotransferase class III-fold pyridoxal phosphate-dependent enzyme, partial [Robiginitalea sp.]